MFLTVYHFLHAAFSFCSEIFYRMGYTNCAENGFARTEEGKKQAVCA
jgi:hypothetical protein